MIFDLFILLHIYDYQGVCSLSRENEKTLLPIFLGRGRFGVNGAEQGGWNSSIQFGNTGWQYPGNAAFNSIRITV